MGRTKARSVNTGPRVYSYIRFSTKEQEDGRSEPRQLELAAAYAKKHGLVLDDTLRMADRGKSAYKGKNILKGGALGDFLAEIKKGRVPRGSVLVVENIDRITRLEFWEAFEVLSSIIRNGVKIHTTSPEMTYDEQCARDGRIYALVGQVNLAHDESSKKAARVRDAWAAKHNLARLEKRPESLTCPKWLKPITGLRDGKQCVISFEVIPAAKTAIRVIFDLRLRGLGKGLICKRLNRGPYWVPPLSQRRRASDGKALPSKSPRWRESYVQKILESRTVVGEFQPHHRVDGQRVPNGDAVPDFYPRIVDQGVFDRVQALLKSNRGKWKGGRVSRAGNLFTRIVKCAYCGAPMAYQPKGPPPRGQVFLICDAGRSGTGCGRSHAVRYDEFQETILDNCSALRPEEVLPKEDEQDKQSGALRERIAAAEARCGVLSEEIENFENLAGRIKEVAAQDAYESKARQRRGELAALRKQVASDVDELKRTELSRRSVSKWTADVSALKQAIVGDSEETTERRCALREHLRGFISKIEVFAAGFKERGKPVISEPRLVGRPSPDATAAEWQRWRESAWKRMPSTAGDIEAWLDAALEEIRPAVSKATCLAFTRYIMQQEMSKKGRFYRIHFKSGAVLDLVPNGSIAMGMALIRDEDEGQNADRPQWRFVYPPIGDLWQQFERETGARKRAKSTRQ